MQAVTDELTHTPGSRPDHGQYWTFQFAGWGAMALLSYLSLTVWYNPGEFAPIVHTVWQSLLGILVSHPLRWIATRTWQRSIRSRIVFNGLAVLAASMVWTVLRISTFTWLTGEVIPFEDWGGWSFASVIVFGAWSFCYHAIKYYRLSAEQRRLAVEAQNNALRARAHAQHESFKRLEAEKHYKEAQLRMLKYQLNPHFFLNALNSVSALVMREDKKAAMDMLARIGDFLRVSLSDPEGIQHTLEEEIDALNLYLSIEKIRFGERLQTRFDVDPRTRNALIPRLLLQPLFENAIKYAVGGQSGPATISFAARREGNELVLEICDDGPGLTAIADQADRHGIGLENVRQRLKSAFGERFSLEISEVAPSGLRAEIRIDDRASASTASGVTPGATARAG